MAVFLSYLPLWKEAFVPAWPVMLNHIFVTAMRTTDMILMGFFGPAAVTAVGLGDVWESIILRIGLGLGTGSISLISQESGVGIGAFTAKTLSALIFIFIFLSSKSEFNLKNPLKHWEFILIKQLFKVSAPKIAQGLYQSLITFPFNSIFFAG
ncbi:MatE protein [Halanaerobium saccharolyticum]|uniref:Probable multidrug resistance protein NorM n=1 Tax=Halanaerobium saccharolyticum TaxID=43595 RepID=A0A4R6SBE9_9FIRM|nr:MATE family efflux transporter [Halanaerobium saccharolyticum]TDP96873.1 MatE protein [Halanaerobium saccharolyticum]